MNFALILASSLLGFTLYRGMFVLIYLLICKIFKLDSNDKKYSPHLSAACLAVYVGFLAIAGVVVTYLKSLTLLEWYLMYFSLAVSLMFWCYFDWEFSIRAVPHFGRNEKNIVFKKICAFSLILIFSFCYNFFNMGKIVENNTIDTGMSIVNATVVSGAIALDRVLNQVNSYLKIRKQEKEVEQQDGR